MIRRLTGAVPPTLERSGVGRPRHRPRLIRLLGLSIALLGAGLIIRSATESRAPAELASSQWQRLQKKIARAVEKDRHRSAGTFVVASTGPSADRASMAPPLSFPAGSPVAPSRRSLQALDGELLARQSAQYEARRAKSVIELQQFRRTYEARISDGRGRGGNAVLINLNPHVNFWYLLQITWDGQATASYHLTNSRPESHDLLVDASFPAGLLLEDAGVRTRCELWSDDSPSSLAAAARQKTPYVTLCDDEVVLRRPTAGRRTKLEWATDFLRDNVWGGEELTALVRDNLYNDAQLVRRRGDRGRRRLRVGQRRGGRAAAGTRRRGACGRPADPGRPRPGAPDAAAHRPGRNLERGARQPGRLRRRHAAGPDRGHAARVQPASRQSARRDRGGSTHLSRRLRPLALRDRLRGGNRAPAGRMVRARAARDARRLAARSRRHRRHRAAGGRRHRSLFPGGADGGELRRRLQALPRRLQLRRPRPAQLRQPLRLHRERRGAEQAAARPGDDLRARRRRGAR